MGIQKMSDDTCRFLYIMFNEMVDTVAREARGLPKDAEEAAQRLALDFGSVAYDARWGKPPEQMDKDIDMLKEALSNPALKDLTKGVKRVQDMHYKEKVSRNKSLESDLGTYSKGIF